MKKIIRKYGGSFIIRITPDEMGIHDIKEGDIIDIEIIKVIGKVKK